MLVLTRNIGQRIMIGDDVIIEILGVKGFQVSIGIDADISIPVHREEIFDKIKSEGDNRGNS